jgi:hypothetical protein
VTTPTNTSSSAYACGGGIDGNFSIAIVNTGPPLSPEEQAAVTSAANKWTSVIVGDTPGVPGPYTIPANSSCGNSQPISLPGGVDDMLVLITFAPLPSNDSLGCAGVCTVATDGTASIGFVTINSNPSVVTVGQFDDIGHVVNYAEADPYVLPVAADVAADVGHVVIGDKPTLAHRQLRTPLWPHSINGVCLLSSGWATPAPFTMAVGSILNVGTDRSGAKLVWGSGLISSDAIGKKAVQTMER